MRSRVLRSTSVLLLAFAVTAILQAQRGPARAELSALVEHSRTVAGAQVRAALEVRLPEGYHTNSNAPRDPSLIPLTLAFGDLPAGIDVTEIVFPDATDLVQQGADQPLRVFDGRFAIGIVFAVAQNTAPGTVEIPATLRYQACDEVACYLPVRAPVSWTFSVGGATGPPQHPALFSAIKFGTGERPGAADAAPALPAPAAASAQAEVSGDAVAMLERFEERGTTTGYQGTDDFLTFIRNAENGVREKGLFEGRGPFAILLLVLLGGLALNLTPCVLPMIPINLAIIGAGAQSGSRMRGFLLGTAYGGAMAAVYGVLGLIVVLTASTFGTINASPWFNLAIAVLFVVLALAMFDVLSIDFSALSTRIRVAESGSGSFAVAFGMGGVAALLAGACVAPVVIQVVLFSSDLYASGTGAALALPFVLGVGMAIPWPIAGAGIAALPAPGAWMVRVKQLFGVLILATAVYYGWQAYGLFANRWVNADEVSSSVAEKLQEGWYASLPQGLAAAERDGKPVLIDMWATWCKNCLVMDRTTLKDPAVQAALANYVKVKFQAEDPDDPRVAGIMQALGARGLPTYVILEAKRRP